MCGALEKNIDACMNLMDSDGDKLKIDNQYKWWINLYDDFLEVDKKYIQFLQRDAPNEYYNN